MQMYSLILNRANTWTNTIKHILFFRVVDKKNTTTSGVFSMYFCIYLCIYWFIYSLSIISVLKSSRDFSADFKGSAPPPTHIIYRQSDDFFSVFIHFFKWQKIFYPSGDCGQQGTGAPCSQIETVGFTAAVSPAKTFVCFVIWWSTRRGGGGGY